MKSIETWNEIQKAQKNPKHQYDHCANQLENTESTDESEITESNEHYIELMKTCMSTRSQLLLVVSPVVSLFQHFQFLLLGTAALLAYYCCWYHTHLLAFLQQLCI